MLTEITAWVQGNVLILGLAGATVLALAAGTFTAKRLLTGKKPMTVLNVVTNLVALGFNAEGMFFVIRDFKDVPVALAWGGFAVFELFQVQLMILAHKKYTKERTPGKFAALVWVIALCAAFVVSTHAHSGTEKVFRIVLPALVVLIWHVSLTADGVTKSRWVFAHWWESQLANAGLKIGKADDESGIDYDRISRDRKIRKLVTLSDKVRRSGKLSGYRVDRLNRLLRNVPKDDMARVVDQIKIADAGRVALGLEVASDVPDVPGRAGTQVRETGTSGTGTQVREAGTSGMADTGTSGTNPAGTGTDEDPGTDTDPDQVRAWTIVRYMDDLDTTSVPAIKKLRELCAAPGRSMSSQDVAIRARDQALVILMQREEAKRQIEPGE